MSQADAIERGTCETRDGTRVLRFTLRLPHPVPRVWAAVASSGGLRSWLAVAEPFEPRIGGAITLRRLSTEPEGEADDASGTVTAWDVERVAEYTVGAPHSRIRFHLEPPRGDHVVLRFTHEFRGDDARCADRIVAWHAHFERLVAALAGDRAAEPS
ncbi:SRPBCC domain-containing protein [Streptomyces sp. NPDC058620]|uniref:SRPBCC domain-containing protein n=1 Tax=Streptomyces sp. NPDC058620 TaxID=3346560 RepID=UPI00365483AE